MEQKIVFRQLLAELKEKAQEQKGKISAQEAETFLKHAGLSGEQMQLVYQYLTDQKIRVEGFTDTREETGRFSDFASESPDEDPDDGAQSVPVHAETDEQENGRTALELYLEEVSSVKQIDPLIELEVYHRAAGGDRDAREQIMSAMLSTVCDLAGEMEQEGVAPEDLIQEGNMELWMALEELEREDTLAAYQARLMNRVGKAMEEMLQRSADVRNMDLGMVKKVRRLDDAIKGLKEELGRTPTAEELSAFLDMPLEEIQRTLKLASN